MEDQRSAYTKSFRLSDGTVSTVEYESDVHYKDEDGEWQPINNSLIFEDVQGNTGAEAEAASLAAEVAENTGNTGDTQVQSSEQEVTDPSENAEDVEETDGYKTEAGKVNFKFAKNANAAWFDGIALKKEPAQTYKYDKEGNNAWSV